MPITHGRAAAYLRSAATDPASIERQLGVVREEAELLGYALAEADVFRDDGQPGDTLSRPGWAELEGAVLGDNHNGEPYACVLVADPTRVLRGFVDEFTDILKRFALAGVPILWADEGNLS
ncbi:MAG: hypothetical protein AVDCRST_MAG68-3365 [uncultured Gemmatimonadetes bacterium]|uniref:Resolvase/invertase-type recombinase catalytic domain-containing protein n=1 Tax=uncultured Gemmatimonadota bacterium TaxID=203437 RepID=A0A6J4LKG3_9BACT|nr:MAG: hypothetical protein AVDCRST_MAG68-3365 [uncultured Gemmatimonadota bacterium]